MLVTFSSKFNALDSREAALLEDISGEARIEFEKLLAAYEADFRPRTQLERDNVYCMATLRWGIDRIRAAEENSRAVFLAHGYVPTKFKTAIEELAGYRRELNIRYEYFFSYHYQVLLKNKAA